MALTENKIQIPDSRLTKWQIKTPVVLIVFNRPDATAKVLEKIAEAKPPKLLVISDGPRPDNPLDEENCRQVRKIIEKVAWPCEVLTNYSDINLGCKMRVVTGLDWAFSIVEEAIILEDDCIPHFTFFRFCEELLGKYRNDERVAIINGTNLFLSREKNFYSYYFSIFPSAWGWATWRRVWANYDIDVKKWPALKNSNWLENILNDRGVLYDYWKNVFDLSYQHKTNTWDYQLIFSVWVQRALAVIPSVNLISNIGYGRNSGTHHFSIWHKWHKFSELKLKSMEFPLSHPPAIFENKKAERFLAKYAFSFFRPFLLKVFLYIGLRLKRCISELFN